MGIKFKTENQYSSIVLSETTNNSTQTSEKENKENAYNVLGNNNCVCCD